MDKKRLRILVYVVGMFMLALGLTLNTKANLGVSPIISVPYSISQITGLNFGDLTFVVYAIFVVVQIIIHIRLKNHKIIASDILTYHAFPLCSKAHIGIKMCIELCFYFLSFICYHVLEVRSTLQSTVG